MELVLKIGKSGRKHVFIEDLQKATNPLALNRTEFPDWVKLDCEKCPHCPLKSDARWCPAAASMADVVEQFADTVSFESVLLECQEDNFHYSENTTAANALTKLLVAKLAHSACPVLRIDDWAREYFSPRINLKNVLFRRLAIRLVCEHLSELKGKKLMSYLPDDIPMLQATLRNLIDRLDHAEQLKQDAVRNAIVALEGILEGVNNFMFIMYNELEGVLRKEGED